HARRVDAHAHYRALAAGLLDLRDGEVQGLPAIVRELRDFLVRCHECPRHGLGASSQWRPEYIPKLPLSPARAERVCHMLQSVVHDGDAVETVDVRGPAEAVHPDARCLHQLAPFRPGHGLQRAAECRPSPGLHLDERHDVALPCDEIDFRMADAEPVCHDLPAAREQIPLRLLLASESPFLTLIMPARCLPPYPALPAFHPTPVTHLPSP